MGTMKTDRLVEVDYGYGWKVREGVGTPDLLVRLRSDVAGWLRVEDGVPSTARTIITILPGGWAR